MKKRALLSVSNKIGIIGFAQKLSSLGYEIISTGGTKKLLDENGLKTISVSEVTNFPECLDGRVKTLHPAVHAGLLAMRDNPEHIRTLEDLNINTIDVVAVNLYPFKETINREGVKLEEAIENIDIGGPTMIRSAAKNYRDVIVVVDPDDYDDVINRLEKDMTTEDYRLGLAYKVFQHTAVYDTMISGYLRQKLNIEFPEQITFAYEKKQTLRYGENPHQKAAYYKEIIGSTNTLANAVQLHGKELSYNNINDTCGALDLLREFDFPTAVAVKHSNPCGVGSAETIFAAYEKAYNCDPKSIYGGIVALNREVDEQTAEMMSKIFLEIVIAPSFTPKALEILSVKPNIRLLELKGLNKHLDKGFDLKMTDGGILYQEKDLTLLNRSDIKVVTEAVPDELTLKQLEFAFAVVKHTKSNAIVVARDYAAIGIGMGQTNRIWAAKQAIEHAGDRVNGAVMASDAYFPFDDCIEECSKAKIKAVIQPGGSIRDKDSIDLCNKYGISMVFTGCRHFRH